MYVLNMPDNSYDLLRLPAKALNTLRRAFVDELGVEVNGPGGVGLYLFGAKQFVLYNMSDDTTPMKIRSTQKALSKTWKELVRNEDLPVKFDSTFVRFNQPVISEVSVTVKPFEIAVVEAP
jgi:hypothetical protein